MNNREIMDEENRYLDKCNQTKKKNQINLIDEQLQILQCQVLEPAPLTANDNIEIFVKEQKSQKKKSLIQVKDKMYGGSLLIIGSSNYDIKIFPEQRQLNIDHSTRTSLVLSDWNNRRITVQIVFANYVHEIILKGIANIRFFYHLQNIQKGIVGRMIFPIRMDIYINQNILNPQFYTQSFYDVSFIKENQEYLFQKLKCCQMLIYLLKKCGVKVINRGLVVPPPKINLMMRSYRTETIGHKTKSVRNSQRINSKIKEWKCRFQKIGQYYGCICLNNIKQIDQNFDIKEYYRDSEQQYFFKWEERRKKYQSEIYELEKIKNTLQLQFRQQYMFEQEFFYQNKNKILKQIGADIFIKKFIKNQMSQDKQNQPLDEQEENYDEQINRKNNIQLLRKFQQENQYFRIHPTPPNMLNQLKSYQGQALQWMKKRQGKIEQNYLFREDYLLFYQLEKQRKLSIFWEEVQLITGQTIFYNHLTGEFSKQFKNGRQIKGGILADQMGLGKTVMMLALLADQNFQGTNLIVVPVSVLKQWQKQIQRHCGGEIKVLNYNDENTSSRRKINFKNYQVVLVTYQTLATQFKFYQNSINLVQQSIFTYKFRRIILDEAHQIREIGTLKFKSAMSLKGEFKWCLTGTLVQNSQKDLFPILKFLQIQFFSEEKWWNKYIKNSVSFQSKLNILYTILRSIILRRTKNSTILSLPTKHQHSLRPQFSSYQQRIYKQLQKGAVLQLDLNMKGDKNYVYAFSIINKLRQFCCHPQLVIGQYKQVDLQNKSHQQIIKMFFSPKLTDDYKNQVIKNMAEFIENCTICFNKPDQTTISVTKCGHVFCLSCITQYIEIRRKCPICRENLVVTDLINPMKIQEQKQIMSQKYTILSNAVQNSSKMTSILEIVDRVVQKDEKCIIFTQWLQKLRKKSIDFATVKGSMSYKRREKQIQKLRNNLSCKILIVSIRAGNTGINLQAANNVIICDPWWNPNQQDQAIGRVHRLGQQKQVNVYRMYMKNSIQEKIQKLHTRKRMISQQIMMNKESLNKKSMDVIEQLLKLMKGD